jgi:hypothetical protein
LVLIFRSFSSLVHVRASDRSAAFVALLNGEISAAGVGVEGLVEMLGRRAGGHRFFDEGRARKNHVDLALLRDGLVEAVEVIEL